MTYASDAGGDGIWLMVDVAAAITLAGWGLARSASSRRDGVGQLLQWSGLAWAVAALCERGALSDDAFVPFGDVTDQVQVISHILARSLLVAAVIVLLPDREEDGFLRRGPLVSAGAALTVVALVTLTSSAAMGNLSETPFGFGNRVWIEAGRGVSAGVLAALVVAEAAALVAHHRSRQSQPPTSFQLLGWTLLAAAVPLTVGSVGDRLPEAAGDVFTLLVFPALPVVVTVALLRALSTMLTSVNDLRLAQRRLIGAVESERRQLRNSLHDSVGPPLAGIALGIRAAEDQVREVEPALSELLRRLAEETERCLEQIRRIVYDLRPPLLDELGFEGAVLAHARRCTSAPAGPSLSASIDVPAPLPAALEVVAFAIVAEAVTNVVRHARASLIEVRIRVDGDELTVHVCDDGCGLPADLTPGVGLISMRERALSVGGTVHATRPTSGGTLVECRLPLTVQ